VSRNLNSSRRGQEKNHRPIPLPVNPPLRGQFDLQGQIDRSDLETPIGGKYEMTTITYKVHFGKKKKHDAATRTQKRQPTSEAAPMNPASEPHVSRSARLLALAHYIDRAVDSGLLKDYAAAARLLGMTRARMSQVMNRLMLSPEIEERILMGDTPLSERQLRKAMRHQDWQQQADALCLKTGEIAES
jgi:hypothetical protein